MAPQKMSRRHCDDRKMSHLVSQLSKFKLEVKILIANGLRRRYMNSEFPKYQQLEWCDVYVDKFRHYTSQPQGVLSFVKSG